MGHMLPVYADDINKLGENINNIKRNARNGLGLEANAGKVR
jgi:hypothetical protein